MAHTVRTSVDSVPGVEPGAKQLLRDRRPETLSPRSTEKKAADDGADFKEPEQGSDELVVKKAEEDRVAEVLKKRDRHVKFATVLMLSAAESILLAKEQGRG